LEFVLLRFLDLSRMLLDMKQNSAIAQKISRSRVLAEYERAFAAASGLPMKFEAVAEGVSGGAIFHRRQSENPFCALISQSKEGCRMCSEIGAQITKTDPPEIRTQACIAGLSDTAVPVVIHGQLAGFLRTGQVALEPLQKASFSRVAKALVRWGLDTDLTRMEEAWYHSKVLTPQQYSAFIELLQVFSRHLSIVFEGEAAAPSDSEAPLIQKARNFIREHQQEDLHVGAVAKQLNMSVFYFCKVFKKATGLTFTEYLAQVRVTKAKNLLQNPHARITEVAFEAGFQSITHFNRSFKKFEGKSPKQYRAVILG
jgi:AraC-like DNA-binding protein/ligand-binding sensor protein